MIVFDPNTNDGEALLRHDVEFKPNSGDVREDPRLRETLLKLKEALVSHLEDASTPAAGSPALHRCPWFKYTAHACSLLSMLTYSGCRASASGWARILARFDYRTPETMQVAYEI